MNLFDEYRANKLFNSSDINAQKFVENPLMWYFCILSKDYL